MASNMNTVYNRLLKKPATAYNNWAQGPLQNTPASTEYVSHHFFNSWIPASLGPVFADLGSFPEFEEQEIDLISMRNPLLDGNFIVQSDIDTSRTLPHSMKAPLENVPLPISKDCTFSETNVTPTPLICPWDKCKRPGPFSKKGTLDRHIQTQHVAPRAFKCPQIGCDWSFNRTDNLNQHRRSVHQHVIQKAAPLRIARLA